MSFQSAIGQPLSQAISVASLLYTQTGRFKAKQAEKELKYTIKQEEKKAGEHLEAIMNLDEPYTPREEMSAGQKAAEEYDVQALIEHAKRRLDLDPSNKEARMDLEHWTDFAAEQKQEDAYIAKKEKAQEAQEAEKKKASADFAKMVKAPETPADRARKAVMDEQMRIRGGKEYNVSI